MFYTILSAVMAYIATNIDDMIINMLLFSSSKSKKDDTSIVLGKYLGIAGLMAISIAMAAGAQATIAQYVHLLGFVPVFLGIKSLRNNTASDEDVAINGSFILSTAAITIASGGDNIGVYVPLFASFDISQFAIVVIVFAFMTALWCALGKSLANMPAIKNTIKKYSNIITPVVYITLGLYILLF